MFSMNTCIRGDLCHVIPSAAISDCLQSQMEREALPAGRGGRAGMVAATGGHQAATGRMTGGIGGGRTTGAVGTGEPAAAGAPVATRMIRASSGGTKAGTGAPLVSAGPTHARAHC